MLRKNKLYTESDKITCKMLMENESDKALHTYLKGNQYSKPMQS